MSSCFSDVQICSSSNFPTWLYKPSSESRTRNRTGMDLRFIGACAPLFLLALLFDVVGFVLLFVGIFANLQVNGRFYGDFLIHTGGVLVFCSLGWWLMWYAGNIQVSREGASRGRGGTAHRCKQLARKLTERLSRTQPGERAELCVTTPPPPLSLSLSLSLYTL
uniref:Transmembrane protein 238a n=1 Tax=Astyanax mexicanus TaxID=7994 RepID=A0A8B9J8P5_ASTMX